MKPSLPPLLVLAGGFGTRLRSVLLDRPKPLALVGDVPFLHLLLERWVRHGVSHFVFLLHYQAEMIVNYLHSVEQKLLKGCNYLTVVEPEPLGTGGAIAHALGKLSIDGNFGVANADTWNGGNIAQVLSSSYPAMAVSYVDDTSRYGAVDIDDEKRVARFVEKDVAVGPGWINAGIYHLYNDLFSGWDGRPFSLEKDVFPNIATQKRLRAIPLRGEFIDIGLPEDYSRFSRWNKEKSHIT